MSARTQTSPETKSSTSAPTPSRLMPRRAVREPRRGQEEAGEGGGQSDLTNQPPLVQTKPLVSQPGDRHEQEADRAAAHVMSGEAAPLSAGEPSIQRQVADEEEEAAPLVEATEPETAPISESAEAAETPAGESSSAGLIVEDDASPGPGQMSKSAFLDELRASACAAADAELAAVGRSTEGCPYVERAIGYYRTKGTAHIERAIHKYAPDTASVTTARDYIPLVSERIRQGVARWAQSGDMSGVPEELLGEASNLGLLNGLGAAAGLGGLFFKARAGGAKEADPQAIRSQLKGGHSLEGGVRTRMESAFGYDFSRVRVHTDGQASQLSSHLNARAFTVGSDVAFGAGEYQPGTLVGDALLAHELAHVVQQGGGATTDAPQAKGDGAYTSLEEDADRSAVGAVMSMWSGAKNGLAKITQSAMPQLKSGLRLSRCKDESTPSGTKSAPSTALPKKTVTVNPTKLYGSTSSVDSAITYANTKVYNQASVEVKKGSEVNLDKSAADEKKSKEILGNDLILEEYSDPTKPTDEEKNLFKENQTAGKVTFYFVKGLSAKSTGESFIPARKAGIVGSVMGNSGVDSTFSHELGHVLLDIPGYHHADSDYIMYDSSSPTKYKLTPTEIDNIRKSPYAT